MVVNSQNMTLNTWYAKRIIGDVGANTPASALLQTGISNNMWIFANTARFAAQSSSRYGIYYVYDSEHNHDKIEFYGGGTSAASNAWIQLDSGDAWFKGNITIGNSASVSTSNLLSVYGKSTLYNTLTLTNATPQILITSTGTPGGTWYIQNNNTNNIEITDGESSSSAYIKGWNSLGFTITNHLYVNANINPSEAILYNLYVNGTAKISDAAIFQSTVNITGNTSLSTASFSGAVTMGSTLSVAEPTTFAKEVDITVTSTANMQNKTGALVIGSKDGAFLIFDNDSINARQDTTAATLFLNNNGGNIQIGGGGTNTSIFLNTTSISADWYIKNENSIFSIQDSNSTNPAMFIGTPTSAAGATTTTYAGFSISPRLYINDTVDNTTYNLKVVGVIGFDISNASATSNKSVSIFNSTDLLSFGVDGIQAYTASGSNFVTSTLVLNNNGGNVVVGATGSGKLQIDYTSDSSTLTSNALYVAGGIGIAQNAYIGGNLNVTTNASIGGTTSLTGAVTMASTATISGATTINNTLTVGASAPTIILDGTTDWKIINTDTDSIFTIIDDNLSNNAYIKGYKTYGFVIYPHLYIGYTNALTSSDTYSLYVNGTTNLTGNTLVSGTIGITGLATLSGGISATTVTTSSLITGGTNIYAGSSSTNTIEHDCGADSAAGKIYLYSLGSASGDRGIWLHNADDSLSTVLFTVNQQNHITASARYALSNLIFHNTSAIRGGTTTSNSNVALTFKSSETDDKDLATIKSIYTVTSATASANKLAFTIFAPKASSPSSGAVSLISETTDGTNYSTRFESEITCYIKQSTPRLYLVNTTITKGTVPSSDNTGGVAIRDANNSNIGYLICGLSTDSNPTSYMHLMLAPSVLNNETYEGIVLKRTVTSGTIGPLTTTIDGDVTIQANTTTSANNYTRLRLSITDTTLNHTDGYDVLRMYHTHDSSSVGTNVTLCGGGNLLIGGGESAVNLCGALYSAAVGSQLTGEDCFVTADDSIYLEANAGTIANRIGIKLTKNGNLLPVAAETENDNSQNLGSSTARWKNIYGVTMNINTLRFKHASLVKGTNPSGNTWFGYIYAFESGDDYDQENRLAAQETRVTANGTCEYYVRSYAFKAESTEHVYLKLAITNAETPARSAEINGLLKLVNNDNTVTIGSQNANYCHIYNSENIPFAFNKTVLTTSGDLGTSSFPWGNLIIASGGRISGNGGALYLGNSDNANWVYLQNCASQASGQPWKLTQAGVLTCVEVDIVKSTTIANRSSTPSAIYFKPHQTDNNLTYSGAYIAVYDDGDTANSGTNMVIRSGGNTIISGGECASSIYTNAVVGNSDNANISVGANEAVFREADENLILCADKAIYFLTNCGTIENRNLSYLTTAGHLYTTRTYNAVWNDYAECRNVATEEPGYCVTETSNGCMIKTTKRLQAGCKITSDTYGVCMGQTNTAKTPIAVSGRVLVYPYRSSAEYKLGAAVCSAPNGTVDIMTRDEIMMYPERIVGTVSEIPVYDVWYGGGGGDGQGDTAIPVNGRIWIYVR